ncbi:MAG: HD domain-containing protein [Promethearchaeota archaeon]|nr:MAG: HD domain-containing protein [Candidatus Lokiarchaeota archaeon]
MMNSSNKLRDSMNKIVEFAKNNMVKDFLHGWSHVERVIKYARYINNEVKANWEIIYCAVLLHDIGHKYGSKNHNVKSAEITDGFLKELKIEEKTIENIKHSILTHSRQYATNKPTTPEAKVLFDADGMDLFGAIGLMRALLSCTLKNKGFTCIIKKCEWRLEEVKNFYNDRARVFVKENSMIIELYLSKLKEQLKFL